MKYVLILFSILSLLFVGCSHYTKAEYVEVHCNDIVYCIDSCVVVTDMQLFGAYYILNIHKGTMEYTFNSQALDKIVISKYKELK